MHLGCLVFMTTANLSRGNTLHNYDGLTKNMSSGLKFDTHCQTVQCTKIHLVPFSSEVISHLL